jgi:hypothetical protein
MNQRDIPALMGRGYPPGRTQRPAVIAPLLRTFDGIVAQGLSAIQDRTPHEEILITNCEAEHASGFPTASDTPRQPSPSLFAIGAYGFSRGMCEPPRAWRRCSGRQDARLKIRIEIEDLVGSALPLSPPVGEIALSV